MSDSGQHPPEGAFGAPPGAGQWPPPGPQAQPQPPPQTQPQPQAPPSGAYPPPTGQPYGVAPAPPAYPAYQQAYPPAYQQGYPPASPPAYQQAYQPAYQPGAPGQGYAGYAPTSTARFPVATVVLLVVSAISLIATGIIGIPSAIVAAVAWRRHAADPASARKLTMTGWIVYAVNFAVGVPLLIWFYVWALGNQ